MSNYCLLCVFSTFDKYFYSKKHHVGKVQKDKEGMLQLQDNPSSADAAAAQHRASSRQRQHSTERQTIATPTPIAHNIITIVNAQNPTYSSSSSSSSSGGGGSSNSAGDMLTSTDRGQNNGSAPRLPGIGRGDGAEERQPLMRSYPDLIYNNVQTAPNKRSRVFSPSNRV